MITPLMGGKLTKEITLMIEDTIARYAGQRIDKVIGAGQVFENIRARALEIRSQNIFIAWHMKCDVGRL
jgi:hypothetical protein